MSKNYVAQISNNIVAAIIVADYEWVQANLSGEWIDLGGEPLTVAVNYVWDGTTFNPPPPPTPLPEA